MTGGKVAGAVVIGLLVATGTALGAGWGTHDMTSPTASPMGVSQTASPRHEFRGRITGVSHDNWFRMRTNRGRLMRIRVSNNTRWNDCTWDSMRMGRHVDVHAFHHNGSWMASSVSPWMGNWNDHWGDMGDHMDDWGHMGDHMGDGWGR